MLRYEKWKERSKAAQQAEGSDDEDGARERRPLPANHPAFRKAQNAEPKHKKGPRSEIKRPEQIMKKRKEDEKKLARQNRGKKKGGKGGGRGGGKGKGRR